ncbi:hypothetical protein [Silvanigrella aquatica]|uniref:Uncharacterized protein n=1 Tax=Silvanigrella aquatica TaxID=1915309 RepID=A0A1L4CYU9_9BACT|nr:hypothetical protein [Silvanigrella aquatica]APJ03110.1 hypothetical protein AXG55_03980 [Silvanigrella aquatica]
MRFYKNLIIINTLFISFFLINFKISATESYVICANSNKYWHWLSEGNIKVQGKWFKKKLSHITFYKIFILDNGEEQYNLLKKDCIQQFGEYFQYPHPSDGLLSAWAVFAIDVSNLKDGFIDKIKYYPLL